jgi:ubiquinone/menaquinone biosynthesis C-methylase UbiE
MDLPAIREHWQTWAREYGTDLRATTKASTAKRVEIDALGRAIGSAAAELGEGLEVLEVGCGNGQNCLSLLDAFPRASFTGVDFIEEMIDAASALKAERSVPDDRLQFVVGDVLDLALAPESFDVVFTDRCLINLNTDELQHQAIAALAERLRPGGQLIMIENCQQTHASQNLAREAVGLPPRPPASFNHFFDETSLLPFLPTVGLELLDREDFISLHDLALYVLVPMLNGGEVDYDHPLVAAAAQLNAALSAIEPGSVGSWGQNRLYRCRRTLS